MLKFSEESNPNWEQLKYLLKHKKDVYLAGRELGASPVPLLLHDWSKFKPQNWGPYRDYWFGPQGIKNPNGPTPEVQKAFRARVSDHYHSEKHHLHKRDNPTALLDIPLQTRKEIVSDWYAVSKHTEDPHQKGPYPGIKTWLKRRNLEPLVKESSFEKIALNALKARQLAQKVGLIPEGQWKWALRNLRDSRGDVFTGKALADKKIELGSISNNSYQKLKSLERKHGAGIPPNKGKNIDSTTFSRTAAGIELGGVLDNKGRLEKFYIGSKGSVSHDPADFLAGKRIVHTHPSAAQLHTVSSARKDYDISKKLSEDSFKDIGNSGLLHYVYSGVVANSAKRRDNIKNYLESIDKMNSSHANILKAKNTGLKKTNPLLVAPSGIESIDILRTTQGNKNKIKHSLGKIEQKIVKHNEYYDEAVDLARQGKYKQVDNFLHDNNELMVHALKQEHQRNVLRNPSDYFSSDVSAFINRSRKYKNPTLDNILAPSKDLESVTKTYPSGRMRTIYFNRGPKREF